MNASKKLSTGICMAVCATAMFTSTTQAQSSERVVVRSPDTHPKKRLRIRYGTTVAEYRQQILAVVPLGSTYEQVETFARAELQTETHPADSMFDPAIVGERNTPRYIWVETELHQWGGGFPFREKQLQEQPSFAKVLNAQHELPKGTNYMGTSFQAKPIPLGPWINLSVMFIFDRKHRLLEIFCHVGGRSVTGP